MNVLEKKTAIVTGGGTGIGFGIAKLFFEEGASVILCGRRKDVLQKAAAAIAGEYNGRSKEDLRCIQADCTKEKDVTRLVEETCAVFGGIDIVANCAGIMRFSPLEETTLENWDEMFRINTYAPWLVSRMVLPEFRRRGGGSIINISSISGLRPNPGSGVYNTSKAALQMMSQTMALETAKDNIRVNVIAPGAVEDTELGDSSFGKENVASFYPRLASLHPMGTNGKPLDIAEAALFLASEKSRWITGIILPVDGGRHMVMNSIE